MAQHHPMGTFDQQATAGNFIPAKTQYYVNDGHGRDTYIYNINGGFAPEKQATVIHEIGSFVVQKKQHRFDLAHIHSKPIVYTNNGTGRDTYISQNDGGFRPLHRAGHGKGTYYNQLRKYPESAHVGRKGSQPVKVDPLTAPMTATASEIKFKQSELARYEELKERARRDDFTDAQNHYNPRFKSELKKVHQY